MPMPRGPAIAIYPNLICWGALVSSSKILPCIQSNIHLRSVHSGWSKRKIGQNGCIFSSLCVKLQIVCVSNDSSYSFYFHPSIYTHHIQCIGLGMKHIVCFWAMNEISQLPVIIIYKHDMMMAPYWCDVYTLTSAE